MQGDFSKSLALLKREPPEELRNSEFVVRWRLTQALDAAFLERTGEAVQFLAEAEEISQRNHSEMLGEVALRKGTVFFFSRSWADSELAYRAALQSARDSRDPYFESAALSGLGIIYTRLQRYDEAIELYHSAFQVARKAGARYSLAQILGNTAWCYRKLGDYENALDLYNRAKDAAHQFGIAGDEIYWLTGISNVYYEQLDYSAAEGVLLQGLELARKSDDKVTLIEYLTELAEIAVQTGRVELAEKYYREANALEQTDPIEVAELVLVQAAIEDAKRNYPAAERLLKQAAVDTRADYSQKREAQAYLARIYLEEGSDAKAEREFRNALETIEQVRASVKTEELRVSFLSSGLSLYDDYIDFLVSRKRVRDALRVAELSRARTLAEGLGRGVDSTSLSAGSFHPEELAKQLNSILLFYWIGTEHSYLWVISSTKVSWYPLPAKRDVDPVLRNYRKAILGGRDVLVEQDAGGRELYAKLVAPAQQMLPKGSRVVVLPGEGLYGLNFETLIVPDPAPHFWIEDVTLSEAASLTILATATARSATVKKSLLLIGNPEPVVPDFPALAQAQVEMQNVSTHFSHDQCKVLDGKRATASAYLQSDPRRFSYLHFVTHGTASLTQPLESAVVLSREGESYKLYARDIVAHPLDAQLVTISACNGAGTRAYAGEGLVGLSWAFLRAGAHNVIASLWEVSDASSTGILMDKLYEGLDKGEDPATALHDAKLFILKANSSTVFRKPFYWAPFQLYQGS